MKVPTITTSLWGKSSPSFVEHLELVAQRICKYARPVGRENMLAGSDGGFGTSAWGRKVETRVVWAKLKAMVDGATLASRELW